jgi:hypothetical protein
MSRRVLRFSPDWPRAKGYQQARATRHASATVQGNAPPIGPKRDAAAKGLDAKDDRGSLPAGGPCAEVGPIDGTYICRRG